MATRDYDDIVPVTVFCDECGRDRMGDYIVRAGADSLEIARGYMSLLGWHITPGLDLCPSCAKEHRGHQLDAEEREAAAWVRFFALRRIQLPDDAPLSTRIRQFQNHAWLSGIPLPSPWGDSRR